QIAALRARVADDGLLLPTEREFLDEGYSGATLVRPALEGVRDLIAAGGIEDSDEARWLALGHLRFQDWFRPFQPPRVMHHDHVWDAVTSLTESGMGTLVDYCSYGAALVCHLLGLPSR